MVDASDTSSICIGAGRGSYTEMILTRFVVLLQTMKPRAAKSHVALTESSFIVSN